VWHTLAHPQVIAKERFGKKQQNQLVSEVTILQSVKHPGIIRLYEMYQTPDKIFVVMEKMKADMLEMILSSRMSRLTERITKFLIAQILSALKYLVGWGGQQ
jgi:protein kinase D